MDDVLGYEGKHVVVTGAASGMGEQVARICHELGANVTALDLKPVSTPVKTSITLDLLDQASIDGVVEQIDGPVDAVFSCAGLPGPPFTDLQTGDRELHRRPHAHRGAAAEDARGRAIACIASGAGVGWQQELANYAPLLATTTFEDARRVVRGQPRGRLPDGRLPHVEGRVNQWVAARARSSARPACGINCLNPGPTRRR